SSGKRIKYAAKVTRSRNKKQLAEGLETLFEIALSEAEQMKLAIERSKTQLHSSEPSGLGAHKGTGVTPGVPDVPTYGFDDEQISWKSSDGDEWIDSDNNGDDFVHPKFSTHGEEDKEEDSFDPKVQTPSHVKTTDNEDSDEENKGENVEGDEQDEEEKNEKVEANELYRDVNINLVKRDTKMTDAPRTIIQTTQVIEDTHVIITSVYPEGQQQSSSMSFGFVSNMLNPSPDTGIDSIFNLNTESTSLVDVPVTTISKPPLLSAIILPALPTPLITHLQQTPVPTPATVPSSSLQDLPNIGSLFGFDHRLKTLETDFLEFKQTNQFAAIVSSLPGIVDVYLANKMHEAVKTTDQVEQQVKAQVFKILLKIEKIVNEQLKAEVLTRSSNESKTSHAVAANLSELELKKILIDKMESNKSIHISDEQKNLYKALVDAYKSDKFILDLYGDIVSFKRRRDDEDKDAEPSVGSNRGSKRRRAGKESESTSVPKEKTSKTTGKSTEGSKSHHTSAGESAQAKEPMHTANDLEEPAHQEFETGVTEDQPDEETSQMEDLHESFNELMDTPLDFSAFVMNRLKVDTLTPELLAGPTFELMKGSCKSLQYPHDLRKPLPLILNSRGRQVILFDHFINNDLEHLSGGVSSRKYTTSVTKTKAADYWHIKWIEDLVPNRMWIQVPVSYDKHALWGISHWGQKRQQFYGCAVNRESARDIYSKRRISAVTKLQIVEWHNYKHLDWITVRRDDDKMYKFKEGKLINLTVEECLAFNVSLQMFTRSIVIQRHVEDLQLGVESYQKKLNLTKPDTYRSYLKRREAYSTYSNPKGFFYQNKDKKNRLMRIDELHKFSDGTLNDVRTALNDHLKGIRMKYLPQTIWRQSDRDKAGAMIQAINKQLKTRRIMRSLEKFVGGRPYEGDFRLLQRTI
ncbi:hypothetical protein Tco_1372683, partial [Tanacetum coccineum]